MKHEQDQKDKRFGECIDRLMIGGITLLMFALGFYAHWRVNP
jgi:hypothetical protein